MTVVDDAASVDMAEPVLEGGAGVGTPEPASAPASVPPEPAAASVPRAATVDEALSKSPVVRYADVVIGGELRRFTFQAIGRAAMERLTCQHPPTDEQRERYRAQAAAEGVPNASKIYLRWNPETFPPALLAASSVAPKLTSHQATEIGDSWGEGDFQALYVAALAAQYDREFLD